MDTKARFTPLSDENNYLLRNNVALSRVPEQYRPYVQQYSAQYGVPPEVAATVFHMESNYDPNARSRVGAMGIAQFMPSTWKDITQGDPNASPWNPVDSIKYGTKYLGQLLNQTGGDVDKALAAYNWGIGKVQNLSNSGQFNLQNLPDETRNYIIKAHNLLGNMPNVPMTPANTSGINNLMSQIPVSSSTLSSNSSTGSVQPFNSAIKFEQLMNMMGS